MINHRELLRHCVSIDLETTGTDEHKHAIVSIGATRFDIDGDEFYKELVIPKDAEIDPEALQVNGETVEGLRSRKFPEYTHPTSAVIQLVEWCRKRELGVLIGKNPSFDHRFLKHVWCAAGLSDKKFTDIITYRHLDWSSFGIPLMLYQGKKIPKEGFGTIDMSRFFRMPDEARPHIAINGARYNVYAVRKVLEAYDSSSVDK